MKARNVLNRIYVQRLLFAAALSCVPLSGHAAKAADFGKNAVSSNGKTTTIYPMGSVNATGSTIPVSPSIGGWTAAGNYGFPTGPTGPTVGVNYKGQFADGSSPTGQAMKYPYTAKSSVSREDIAKAVGTMGCSLISGGLATLACMAAVPLISDWMNNSGARVNPVTGDLERKDPTVCTTAPCWEYTGLGVTPTYMSSNTICEAIMAAYNGRGTTLVWSNPRFDGTGTTSSEVCRYNQTWRDTGQPNGTDGVPLQARSKPPSAGTSWLPASMNDIAPYMSQRDPDGGVIGEILSNGGTIPLGVPTITGPTAIKGPETTTTNADGSRTVTSTTNNYTTAGNTVTNNSSVTTTTTYNTDNSVRSTTSTTTVPTEEAEKEDPCKANPERLGCIEVDTPEGEVPKETKTVTFNTESVFHDGSCPADVYASFQSIGGTNAKILDWSTFCGHAVVIRGLVMALAGIMAMFIIMPGGVRE